MFIFRWLKSLIVLILLIAGVIYISNYQWDGKPIKEHVATAYKSGAIAEAYKDIKTWISEIFKIGKDVGDNLTAADRKGMEDVIKNELKHNVEKLKEDAKKEKKND